MFSKQAVCIATAAGGGMKSTCKGIKDSLSFWGVAKIYTYGVAVRAVSWDSVAQEKKSTIEKKTNALARKILKNKARPSVKTKFLFNMMRQMQKTGWCQVVYGLLERARMARQ